MVMMSLARNTLIRATGPELLIVSRTAVIVWRSFLHPSVCAHSTAGGCCYALHPLGSCLLIFRGTISCFLTTLGVRHVNAFSHPAVCNLPVYMWHALLPFTMSTPSPAGCTQHQLQFMRILLSGCLCGWSSATICL